MLNHIILPFHLYVGPPNCTGSVTASRVAAESAVIRWVVHTYTCLGRVPTSYLLVWYPVGGLFSEYNYTFFNSTSISLYTITGLSPGTRYYIALELRDNSCQPQAGYSTLAETMSSKFHL